MYDIYIYIYIYIYILRWSITGIHAVAQAGGKRHEKLCITAYAKTTATAEASQTHSLKGKGMEGKGREKKGRKRRKRIRRKGKRREGK